MTKREKNPIFVVLLIYPISEEVGMMINKLNTVK